MSAGSRAKADDAQEPAVTGFRLIKHIYETVLDMIEPTVAYGDPSLANIMQQLISYLAGELESYIDRGLSGVMSPGQEEQ